MNDPTHVHTHTHTLHRGHRPLLVSVPHAGQRIPSELQPHYVPRALEVEDTDWFLDEVYAFAREMGASLLVPGVSRYVVDLNRPPENLPLYPGVNNTELVPTRSFTGDPLYRAGHTPDDAEVARRLRTWWAPYHHALESELARLKAEHGHVVLFDGHSIKSRLPWLFDGQLPDLNLGTADGASCAPALRAALMRVLDQQPRFSQITFSHVTDGRFKGGYITRHHGRPHQGVHAVQLEMCWRCYMDESPPFRVDEGRAAQLTPVLRALLQAALDWSPHA